MVWDESQWLTSHRLAAQDRNIAEQARGRLRHQAGGIKTGGKYVHSRVINAFKAINQGTTRNGNPVTMSPDLGMGTPQGDRKIEIQLEHIAR